MQLPPLSVLATWPAANYADPTHTRGPAMLVLTVILMPLSFLVVLLRIYTRIRISRSFGADDVCIVIAATFTIVCGILSVIATQKLGWKRHTWDVPPVKLITGLKYVMALEVFFAAGCAFTRMSLLLFIRRLMSPWKGMLRTITWVLMALSAVELVIFTIVVTFTCRPVSAYWTLSFAPQQCINEPAHLLASGIINTFTDFCVVILPIPMVLKLRLPRRQQIILIALFGAGFVTVFAGAVRIYYTYQLNNAYDKTWVAYPLWIAATVELYLGIIAASIPATKKLVSRYLPKILGSSSIDSQAPALISRQSTTRTATRFSHEDIEKIAEEKHKSLQPVLSTFTTWTQLKRNTPSPTSMWKRAHPPSQLFRDKELPPPPLSPSPLHQTALSPPPRRLGTLPSPPPSPLQKVTPAQSGKSTRFNRTKSTRTSISSFNVTAPSELAGFENTNGPADAITPPIPAAVKGDQTVDFWNSSPVELDPYFEPWRADLRRSV